MKIKLILSTAMAVFALDLAATAQSTLAINGAPTGATRSDTYEWGAGFGFYVPAGVGTTINSLGFWDASGTGLDSSHIVALYQYSGSGSAYNLLDSVTVQAGTVDPLSLGQHWQSGPSRQRAGRKLLYNPRLAGGRYLDEHERPNPEPRDWHVLFGCIN